MVDVIYEVMLMQGKAPVQENMARVAEHVQIFGRVIPVLEAGGALWASTLSLQGDHYAMGRQHGRQVQCLRPQIARAMEIRFAQIEEEGPDARFEWLVKRAAICSRNRPTVDGSGPRPG